MQFNHVGLLPARGGRRPNVVQRQCATAERTDRRLRFLKPEGAEGEGIAVAQDVSMYASRLSGNMRVAHEFGQGRGGYLYLISGALDANGTPLKTGDAAYVRGAGLLEIVAGA